MKILVCSDSHGVQRWMVRAVERERPDRVIHLGDHDRDAARLAERYPELPLISLPGNCDYPLPGTPYTRVVELGGVRFFLTHGHPYRVKSGLLSIELAGREAEAQVVLFGHTHRAYCEEKDGMWLMNPGACGGMRPSYGIVEIENKSAACHLAAYEE